MTGAEFKDRSMMKRYAGLTAGLQTVPAKPIFHE
jgi:hypothetical protein